jgi:ribonuclease III
MLHHQTVGSLAPPGQAHRSELLAPSTQSQEWASAFENGGGQKGKRMVIQQNLNTLQAALGHTFRHETLLVRALTHSSLAYEEALESRQGESAAANASRDEDNEQLEFLGDAVLGLLVAEILFRRFPDFREGEWTRLRASLVSRRHMAQVASAIGLGAYLRLGRGEERSDGRSKPALLANCMEAVIAALYLDGGLAPAESFVSQHVVSPYLSDLRKAIESGISLGDHKSALQELLQAQKTGPPSYVLRAESGPDHRKRFLVEVRIPRGSGSPMAVARGVGTTKKKAEQEAARRAFKKLRKREVGDIPITMMEENGA